MVCHFVWGVKFIEGEGEHFCAKLCARASLSECKSDAEELSIKDGLVS